MSGYIHDSCIYKHLFVNSNATRAQHCW